MEKVLNFVVILLALAFAHICLVSSWSYHPPTPNQSPSVHAHPNSAAYYYKAPRNAQTQTELCVRDENQAQIQSRNCLRKCTSDEDCKSKRKKCLCDGACGLSCIKPERECGDPEPPAETGEVRVTGKIFGSKSIYSCPEGFRLIGLEIRVCLGDGTWSGTPPSCRKNIFCTNPPPIDHARHNAPAEQTSFDLDTSLQYECLPGYTTRGFASSKCFLYNGTAKWFGPDITCEPRSCGEPAAILNGHAEGECHAYKCKVAYKCQAGFELVGKLEYTCQANGTWSSSELPTCVPVQCSTPENPLHGKAVYSTLSFNSPVSYECKYGYMLVGETTRRCGSNKKWTGIEPACQEINCGTPGTLYNGWLEGSRTTLHAVVLFHCLKGMTFEGSSDRSVCQSDATWSHPVPKCLAPCIIPAVDFGNVTSKTEELLKKAAHAAAAAAAAANAVAAGGNDTFQPYEIVHTFLQPGTSVAHGTVLGVQCEDQYEPAHNITPPTCNNGTFTHAPKCQPARCKYLPRAPRHGLVIAPKTEHGMKARFACHDGYNLVGINISECQYGSWLGEPPLCNQSYCKFPGNITNGKVLLVGNMGWYDYRNYVTKVANNRQITFECDKGYMLSEGPQWKTCVRGEWAPKTEPAQCQPAKHPSYRWVRSVSDSDSKSSPTRRRRRKRSLKPKTKAKAEVKGSQRQ